MTFLFRHLLQEAKLELKKSKRKDYYKILGIFFFKSKILRNIKAYQGQVHITHI